MKRRKTGILAENLAQDYLEKLGYQIIERNYRCSEGEIDLVARHGDILSLLK